MKKQLDRARSLATELRRSLDEDVAAFIEDLESSRGDMEPPETLARRTGLDRQTVEAIYEDFDACGWRQLARLEVPGECVDLGYAVNTARELARREDALACFVRGVKLLRR